MRNFFTSILMFALSVSVIGASLLSPVFVHGQGTDLSIPEQDSLESVVPEGAFTSDVSQSPLPACGISVGRWFSSVGTIEGCFIRIIYFGVLYPSAFIAGVGGSIFDYLVAYTLNSNSYVGGPESFIEQGWRVLRDIANVSFIFILLYSAIRFILGLDSQSIGKTVARIILVALVINFSLFATRVIVDAGNILGRVFYESIDIQNDAQGDLTGRKSISSGLISLFNPQRLLTSEMFTSYANQSQASLNQVGGQNTLGGAVNETPANGFIILILLIASAMNILIAYIFLSVGIFLIARTVGLWIMMIMSPLAFASVGIPALKGKMGKFGFDGWLSQTISLSFLVVVFLFFLYLTVMFLQIAFNSITSTILGGGMENASVIQIIMSVIIPFAIVFFLLKQAKSQAKQMAGDFGAMAVKGLKMAVVGALGTAGLALGATAGMAAVAGRQVVGRAAAGAAARADTTKRGGRFVKKYGTALANQNFDARNIKIPKNVSSRLRSGLSYATGGEISASDFSLKTSKGTQKSYSKLFEEKTKKKVEEAKMFAPDESSKVEFVDASGATVKSSVKDAQKKLDRKRTDAKQANNYDDKVKSRDKQKKVVEDVRRDYNTAKEDLRDGRITNIEFDSIKRALEAAKRRHEDDVKEVKRIESIWKSEEGAYNNAQKALAKNKTDFFKNYAKSVESWSAFPDAALTHRFDANRAASSKIEDLGIAEEKKSEK